MPWPMSPTDKNLPLANEIMEKDGQLYEQKWIPQIYINGEGYNCVATWVPYSPPEFVWSDDFILANAKAANS